MFVQSGETLNIHVVFVQSGETLNIHIVFVQVKHGTFDYITANIVMRNI